MAESQKDQNELSGDVAQVLLSAQHSAQLCQACGICCNGSLFSHVDIGTREAAALKGTSVKPLLNKKGKPVFGLPCSALSGTSCSIYAKRPGVCQTYLCALTRSVLNEGTDLESALGVVADIKTRRLWLLEHAPTELLKPQPLPSQSKQFSAQNILSAWQTRVGGGDMSLPVPKGLWLLLSKLHPCFAEKQSKEGLSTGDKEFIARAFAYTKICDRLFEKTSLLRKYAELVQRL